jgi:hypothetical protein
MNLDPAMGPVFQREGAKAQRVKDRQTFTRSVTGSNAAVGHDHSDSFVSSRLRVEKSVRRSPEIE